MPLSLSKRPSTSAVLSLSKGSGRINAAKGTVGPRDTDKSNWGFLISP
jgi:hypothetical protein